LVGILSSTVLFIIAPFTPDAELRGRIAASGHSLLTAIMRTKSVQEIANIIRESLTEDRQYAIDMDDN
jgi:hypothetical protein